MSGEKTGQESCPRAPLGVRLSLHSQDYEGDQAGAAEAGAGPVVERWAPQNHSHPSVLAANRRHVLWPTGKRLPGSNCQISTTCSRLPPGWIVCLDRMPAWRPQCLCPPHGMLNFCHINLLVCVSCVLHIAYLTRITCISHVFTYILRCTFYLHTANCTSCTFAFLPTH